MQACCQLHDVAALPPWKQLTASVKQFIEEGCLLPVSRIEPRFFLCSACNLGTTPSTLTVILCNQQLHAFYDGIKTNSINVKACLF
jgi:hypothetical protein